jgi:hypothetical protein
LASSAIEKERKTEDDGHHHEAEDEGDDAAIVAATHRLGFRPADVFLVRHALVCRYNVF